MHKTRKILLTLLCAFVLIGCSNLNDIFKEDKYGIIDLNGLDLSDADLSDYKEKLLESNFDTTTKWPDSLPKGFDYEKLLELGKNAGLNIDKLHAEGVTGKNIGIAIIDQPLLLNHSEYSERIKYTNFKSNNSEYHAFMHGTAVASLAVGKNIGTAPEADLYFIGEQALTGKVSDDSEIADAVAKDIKEIIKINEKLENKIRVISISKGFYLLDNAEAIKNATDEANANNIEVISADNFDLDPIGMPLQRDPYADPNDATAYKVGKFLQENGYYYKQGISIPMDNRTIASYKGKDEYEYSSKSGVSWSIPYLAGVYALALQVEPNLSLDKFLEIANDTFTKTEEVNVIAPYEIIEYLRNQPNS